jgi:RNA polymerase sigma-70 factor (ECF subfamily)
MALKEDAGDRALVRACIDKDLKAWSILVNKYSRLVDIAAVCRLKKYGFTLPKEDIEDLRQDVFTDIWSRDKLKNISDLDDISHWLAAVSGNMAMSRVRSRSNRDRSNTVPIDKKYREAYLADILPSKAPDPGDEMLKKEMIQQIDSAIERLPCRERLMIELHLTHDKRYDEIADLLGVPQGTVSSYIKRARERLKTAIKDFLIIFAIISALFASLYMGG